MEITELKFEEHCPVEVSVTMSVKHAAHLAIILGKLSFNDVGADNWLSLHEFYDLMTGELFNRYWDDGINDYFKESK